MAKDNINSKKGFTIIEVVLVLAIAGLIFLMVFVALPALQRSQRDTARRNDMSRVDTSLVQWQTNHSSEIANLPNSKTTDTAAVSCPGSDELPSGSVNVACEFVRDYMNSGSSDTSKRNEFQDPNGVPYSLVITPNIALKSMDSGTYQGTGSNASATSTLSGDETNGWTITGNDPFSVYMVYIVPGGKCEGSNVKKSEKRHFAVLYRLEGAGTYCIDDQ